MSLDKFNHIWLRFKPEVGNASKEDYRLFNIEKNSERTYIHPSGNKSNTDEKPYYLCLWLVNRKRKLAGDKRCLEHI